MEQELSAAKPRQFTRYKKLVIILTVLWVLLLVTLLPRMYASPGGIILSGFFLGGMMLVLALLFVAIVSVVVKFFFRKLGFLPVFLTGSIVCFIYFHYEWYSPSLTIIVPAGYRGEVNLVLSNVKENRLRLDDHGIGYINEWTFKKAYTRPKVIDVAGNDLDSLLVGFNPGSFWALSQSCCIDDWNIISKSFRISDQKEERQVRRSWIGFVDIDLVRATPEKRSE